MIDKKTDQFIVDCTKNTKEERKQVYEFLIDNRNYDSSYFNDNYPIIVCNITGGDTNYNIKPTKKYLNYPIYTFEEFKEKYLNEFPTKWKINRNLSNKIVDWFIKTYSIHYSYGIKNGNEWLYSEKIDQDFYPHSSYNNYPEFTEITLEQFETHILKEKIMKKIMKKIIGYKCPMDLFEGIIEKNTLYTFISSNSYGPISLPVPRLEIPKEIVETWEPVYETEKLVYNVGDYLMCIQDFYMADGEKDYTKNNIYKCEEKNCITDNAGSKEHTMTFSRSPFILTDYFRLATKEEIARGEQVFNMDNKFHLKIKNGKIYHKEEDITSYVKGVRNFYVELEALRFKYAKIGRYDFVTNIDTFTITKSGCENKATKLITWNELYKKIQ